MHGRGSLPRPRAGPATMAGDPAADRAKNGCGHVETGTMRHQRAPGEEEIGLWRDDLHPASPRPLTEVFSPGFADRERISEASPQVRRLRQSRVESCRLGA